MTSVSLQYTRIYFVYAMSTGILLSILFYAMNVYSVISYTVARQNIEARISEESIAINALDKQYTSLANVITPDRMGEYGLHDNIASIFISRVAIVGLVSKTKSGL